MQFIHITDPHVDVCRPHYGIDSIDNLSRVVGHAARYAPQANFLVLTGDIAHNGDEPSYRAVKEILSRAPCPVFVVPGNHDNASVMAEVFHRTHSIRLEDAGRFMGGIWTDVLQGDSLSAVFLDTHLEEKPVGAVSSDAMALLADTLAEEKCTLVFMHHPPFESGIAAMDAIGLKNKAELQCMLQQVRHKPAGIFCGHLHRTISGVCNGVPVWCLRSTSHQIDMFAPDPQCFSCCSEAPEYGLVVVKSSRGDICDVLCHTVRFTEGKRLTDP